MRSRSARARTCVGVEVVDLGGDADAAELVDQRGRLLDGLGPVVIGAARARVLLPPGAHDGGARLAERGRDAAAGAAGRPGDHRDPAPQHLGVGCPGHVTSIACRTGVRGILGRVTPLQRYIAEEIATDHVDGLLSRREAMRRLACWAYPQPPQHL